MKSRKVAAWHLILCALIGTSAFHWLTGLGIHSWLTGFVIPRIVNNIATSTTPIIIYQHCYIVPNYWSVLYPNFSSAISNNIVQRKQCELHKFGGKSVTLPSPTCPLVSFMYGKDNYMANIEQNWFLLRSFKNDLFRFHIPHSQLPIISTCRGETLIFN